MSNLTSKERPAKNLVLKPPPVFDPLESFHQQQVLYMADLHKRQYPELQHLFAVPNGGFRHKATAEAMRRQGVRPGVPDLILPVARGGYHGWYGEMKRFKGVPSDLSAEQKDWLVFLSAEGYFATWHKGWEAMWASLVWYLSLPPS